MILAICDTCAKRKEMKWPKDSYDMLHALPQYWFLYDKNKIFCCRECQDTYKPLPEGYVPCFGQVIDDPESPLDGTPTLDASPASKFIKGTKEE